jgi:hypothetical protein
MYVYGIQEATGSVSREKHVFMADEHAWSSQTKTGTATTIAGYPTVVCDERIKIQVKIYKRSAKWMRKWNRKMTFNWEFYSVFQLTDLVFVFKFKYKLEESQL